MPYDGLITSFLGQGVAADRPATPNVHPDAIVFWYSTDSNALSAYADSGWLDVPGGAGIGLTDGDKGDIVVSSVGSAWTIDSLAVTTSKINNAAVTLAKIANAAASSKLVGSGASGSGAAYAEITLGTGLTMTGTTLSASGGSGTVTSVATAGLATGGTITGTGTVTVTAAGASDINTGTDTTKALTADALAGSNLGTRIVQIQVSDPAGSAISTGDGKAYFRVPAAFNGMNLVSVAGALTTASSSGIPTVQVANVTDTVDMLSTKLTIDATETDSSTAAAAAVIDGAHDDVATGDMLRLDIDVAGTGAKGLIVELGFQLP